ncbi:hypothetical protein Ddye_018757 [Dipteronia dyeriana]|uniref:Uncharacterized protein n=1 Tax=Dipteronia dyeriana TaxID=168575 RepID=A0AAD9UBM9_9ROSI|nr:hypothetical protein Ddye_018757 [Dipteronia dyeriana]
MFKGRHKDNTSDTASQANGIPTYEVEITNLYKTGCAVSLIKIYCASFSSANLINPLIFRHLPAPDHDSCIVNNGDPLKAGAIVQFRVMREFGKKKKKVSRKE